MAGSLPALIGLYDDHRDHRDRFEIIAVHDRSAKSLADLDEHLADIRPWYWGGRDLPFPVLLDGEGKTEDTFGIDAHPTGVLIDPDGRVVGEADPEDLEARLPPLPAATRWARHRDLRKNVSWDFGPPRTTLRSLADELGKRSGCKVEVDVEAARAAGLTPDGPLPGAVANAMVTLRSVEELLLAPHGLGVAPAADGKSLRITRAAAPGAGRSRLQAIAEKDLGEELDGKAEPGDEAKSVAVENLPLEEAVRRVAEEFDLAVALDAGAIHAKVLDPAAKVSGVVGPGELRKGLSALVAPLGLAVEVRSEVVFITRRPK